MLLLTWSQNTYRQLWLPRITVGDTNLRHRWISCVDFRGHWDRRKTSGQQWSKSYQALCNQKKFIFKICILTHHRSILCGSNALSDDARGNLPHPMNHFNRFGAQIVGGNNRWILRKRKTGEESIDNWQTGEWKFRRPAWCCFGIYVHCNTGAVVIGDDADVGVAICDSGMCDRLRICIHTRHNGRVNWSNYDKNQVHCQNGSAKNWYKRRQRQCVNAWITVECRRLIKEHKNLQK